MSLFVDTSALLKRYILEAESRSAERYLLAEADWVMARHAEVEVRRNLARLLSGRPLAAALTQFRRDWARTNVVALDDATCDLAAQIAEATGARSLDALHLAAASRVGGPTALAILTYDVRQAQVARALGFTVLGV